MEAQSRRSEPLGLACDDCFEWLAGVSASHDACYNTSDYHENHNGRTWNANYDNSLKNGGTQQGNRQKLSNLEREPQFFTQNLWFAAGKPTKMAESGTGITGIWPRTVVRNRNIEQVLKRRWEKGR